MSQKNFNLFLLFTAIGFVTAVAYILLPALLIGSDTNLLMGGFANPAAQAFSTDVMFCGTVLSVWIIYEMPRVKYGWIFILLSFFPGVAFSFAGYLWWRSKYIKEQ